MKLEAFFFFLFPFLEGGCGVWMVDGGYKQTFFNFFCLTKVAFFGAIVRAPFLGPRTLGLSVALGGFAFLLVPPLSPLSAYLLEEVEVLGFDAFIAPCAMVEEE